MIALVDYGAGNLTSVRKALRAVGADVVVPQSPDQVAGMAGIVVPGVGHYSATAHLGEGWRRALRASISGGTPLLGICLGMQWLFDGSDESPETPGLGVFAGRITRLPDRGNDGARLKVPHVGWNTARLAPGGVVVPGVRDGAYVYFTHTYAAPVTAVTAAVTVHGALFASAVRSGSVWGVQFHPEKSGTDGLAVLRAFVNACAEPGTARTAAG